MSGKAGDIFDDVDEVEAPVLPKLENEGGLPKLMPKLQPKSEGADADGEQFAADMRRLAGETGFARHDGREKTVYDYTEEDHRTSRRKVKTFTQNPTTILECFKEYCHVSGKDEKEALYEAFQLLGEKHDFSPLANLPPWSKIRAKDGSR